MLDAGLHDLLEANKASIANASFWPGELPQNQTGACGTYMCVGGSSDPTLDTSGMQRPRYQFDCYGDSALQAMTVRSALIDLLNQFSGTLTDGTVLQNADLIQYTGPHFDQDRRKFYCMVEFYLIHDFGQVGVFTGYDTFASPGAVPPTDVLSFDAVAGEAISAQKVVAIVNDLAYQADSSNLAHLNLVFGVATGGVLAGSAVTIQTYGLMEDNGWNWVAGSSVFLGTDGTLTQTAPTAGFAQKIGMPLDPTTLFIEPQPPVVL